MKRKPTAAPKERNQFVAAALFRKAGAHEKTHKALRKQMKQSLRSFNGEASGSYPEELGSLPSAGTINI
jgi:hypothetical protein